MGNCTSSGGGRGGGGAAKQAPTNAKLVENMNEAQLNSEIAKAKRDIKAAEKAMNANDITNTAEARAMREAFPLGVGGSGWTDQRRKAQARGLQRDLNKAVKFTEANKKKANAEARLKNLEKAKNEVKGTEKTQKEIRAEKSAKAVKSTPKTLSWKTTQKGGWNNGGYSPKIISAGDFQIHGESGLYSIYKGGKLVGRTNKLSSAKAYAEKANKG